MEIIFNHSTHLSPSGTKRGISGTKDRCSVADKLLMKHVNAIKEIVAQGQFEEAHEALADLLELGPHNMDALKLKAALFEHVGRFEDEDIVWRRIIEIDGEDEDAIQFFQRSQLEDREHYYFTDPLPGGGRRFLAYPRALIGVSFAGLIGCVMFLLLTRSGSQILANSPSGVLFAFLMLVVSPWFAIIYLYVRTIRSINITKTGLEVSTRFKTFLYPWTSISNIYLAHSPDPLRHELRLVVLANEPAIPSLNIDFGEGTSAVRARRHLLQGIRDHFHDVRYERLSTVPLQRKGILKF